MIYRRFWSKFFWISMVTKKLSSFFCVSFRNLFVLLFLSKCIFVTYIRSNAGVGIASFHVLNAQTVINFFPVIFAQYCDLICCWYFKCSWADGNTF